MSLSDVRDRVDRLGRAHAWVGFPLAVFKKYGDDGAGNLAALVTFFGFFSLFPLLLAFTAILGIVLRGHETLQRELLDSALIQFPIIGEQISENIGSIDGNGVALAIGLVGALYGGMGGLRAAQKAMDAIWDVPIKKRPSTLRVLLRGAIMLLTLGVFVVVSLGLTAVASGTREIGFAGRALVFGLSIGVNFTLFLVAFRVLTTADVDWRDVAPGAVVAAVAWGALQALGGYYVTRRLQNASELYGFFGIVIGLLSWLYLTAQVTLLAAEVNVVRARRLWPRSLGRSAETTADRRALRRYAKVEERVPDEHVGVAFGDEPPSSRSFAHVGTANEPRPRRKRRSLWRLIALVVMTLWRQRRRATDGGVVSMKGTGRTDAPTRRARR